MWIDRSLASHLLMQLTFIGTGHPAAIVLVSLSASNFFSLRECFSFACVDPFAMGLGW
jgi:hypothetical protein